MRPRRDNWSTIYRSHERERERPPLLFTPPFQPLQIARKERGRERERNELINSGERAAAAAFLFPSPPPLRYSEGGRGRISHFGRGRPSFSAADCNLPQKFIPTKSGRGGEEGGSLPSRGKRSNSLSSATAAKGLHMRWWQCKCAFIESDIASISLSAIVSVHW